jgi:alpha-1,2-mannosyltransferase
LQQGGWAPHFPDIVSERDLTALINRLDPATRLAVLLAMLLFAGCIGAALVLGRIQPPGFEGTVLDVSKRVFSLQTQTDSWEPMANALRVWHGPSGFDVYSKMFFAPVEKFQYPPSALFLAMGLAAGPNLGAISFETFTLVLSLMLLAVATNIILDRLMEIRGFDLGTPLQSGFRWMLVLGLMLTFYPVVRAFALGQAQLWLDALFGMALAAWVTERRALSGALIGTVCLIKPQLGLFLIWGLIRKEWRFAAGLAGICAAVFSVSLVYFGLQNHLSYLNVLSYLSERGESFQANQSLNGLLGRLVGLEDPREFNNLQWDEGLPPYNPVIYFGTLLSSVVILVPALAWRSDCNPIVRALDFCTLALSATMASPIAWEHHYGVIFPIYAVVFITAWGNAWALAVLAASYLLAAHYLPITGMLAGSPLNVVQSYLYFAAIALLLLMYGLRGRRDRRARPSVQYA